MTLMPLEAEERGPFRVQGLVEGPASQNKLNLPQGLQKPQNYSGCSGDVHIPNKKLKPSSLTPRPHGEVTIPRGRHRSCSGGAGRCALPSACERFLWRGRA